MPYANPLILPIHVTRAVRPNRGLCGDGVLDHVWPPEAVELGRSRADGSMIELGDVELEAGWIATAPRSIEQPTLGDLCAACLRHVHALRERAARPEKQREAEAQNQKLRAIARGERRAERQAIEEHAKRRQKAERDAAWEARMMEGLEE